MKKITIQDLIYRGTIVPGSTCFAIDLWFYLYEQKSGLQWGDEAMRLQDEIHKWHKFLEEAKENHSKLKVVIEVI